MTTPTTVPTTAPITSPVTSPATSPTDSIEEQVLLPSPRARVWRALTTAEELGAWFGADLAGATIAPGAHVVARVTIPGYEHVAFDVIIEEMTPERCFAWRWHPNALDPAVDYSVEPRTLVTFTLEDAPDGGTLLRVVESGFAALPAARRAPALAGNSSGWRGQLQKRLPAHLASATTLHPGAPAGRIVESSPAGRLIAELTRESETTRRVLERLPENRLTWRPHAKSMSLGQLALHVAQLPLGIASLVERPTAEVPDVPLPEPASRREVLDALERSVAHAAERLAAWGDAGLEMAWTVTRDGAVLATLPRGEALRSLMLNHVYHHRGQLTVYLRLLDVPLPPVYGPTADEQLFA